MEDQQTKEVGMDRIIAQTKEARMVGVPERTLTDLLLSRHVSLGGGSGGSQGSVIAPFTLVPQTNVVNANYFNIVKTSCDPNDLGTTDTDAGAKAAPQGGHYGGAWAARTGNQSADFGGTNDLSVNVSGTASDVTTHADKISAAADHSPHLGRIAVVVQLASETMGSISSNATLTGYKSQLKNLGRFFTPGSYVLLENIDESADSLSQNAVFRVIEAASRTTADATEASLSGVAVGGHYAVLVLEPNISAAGWRADSVSSAKHAGLKKYLPRAGTISIMANSVSDYEKYCVQGPALNPTNLISYWQQTSRWTHKYSDEYLKALQAPMTSNWFKKFRELPLAQQRKQQELMSERAFYNTVFYGDQINENQTVEKYTSLPTVTDPDVNGDNCVIEYKANALGIRTQLSECGKVYGGGMATSGKQAALNLDVLFETIYQLKRYREATAGSVDTIDIMTDRFTAAQIRDVMIKYYKSKYSTDVNMFVNIGQKVLDMDNAVALEYNSYYLPDQGVNMAIFTDTYFDDRVSAFNAGGVTNSDPAVNQTPALARARGRTMWLIDWSDVAVNLLGTKSVKRQTNLADDQYNCVIQPNVKHYVLNSKKFEVRIGDPNRHAIIENITEGCPTITVSGCDLS
tara:strand:+ start:9366 stop:11258 length:1893 start_codon:yes stop_codon:yes gene_type:complete